MLNLKLQKNQIIRCDMQKLTQEFNHQCNKRKQTYYLCDLINLIYIYKGKGTWMMHYHWQIIPSKLLYESSFYVHSSPYNNNKYLPKKKIINLISCSTFFFFPLGYSHPSIKLKKFHTCSWNVREKCYNS